MKKSVIILLLLLAVIPVVLYGLSKSLEIRGKAANTGIALYGTAEVSDITQTQANIKYVTTGPTTTFVAYDVSGDSFTGAVENMGRWRINDQKAPQTIHSILLSGLVPGTTYYFIVSGMDKKSNKYIQPSQVVSFRTLEKNSDCTRTDLNKDGKTDLKDAALVQKCLNTVVAGECAGYDLTSDGKIDILDINFVTDCF